MFSTEDVKDYYNTTHNHYVKWWDLKNSLSLHYGIWDENTKNFSQALKNTNKVLSNIANITSKDRVLDAGCGVGGTAFYLASQFDTHVTGITLSDKQLSFANQMSKDLNLEDQTDFHIMDYTDTTFKNDSFDVVWACESVSSAIDKKSFIKEAYRLLKPGGRLILSDYLLTSDTVVDSNNWLKKWADTWSISGFDSNNHFSNMLKDEGFVISQNLNYSSHILKSSKRMYYAYFLGFISSNIYNLFHPNVSRFAKNHYKTGYYQYKTLIAEFWEYRVILATK